MKKLPITLFVSLQRAQRRLTRQCDNSTKGKCDTCILDLYVFLVLLKDLLTLHPTSLDRGCN